MCQKKIQIIAAETFDRPNVEAPVVPKVYPTAPVAQVFVNPHQPVVAGQAVPNVYPGVPVPNTNPPAIGALEVQNAYQPHL